ncbi:uncharacterized protein DFL_000418 [Arthrobotrys flagrans]|uniref:Uncharacterized protein n=1 Tax=Arthrobotrys flagrans TaxID=97331 RepID=A0A437AE92_ARTFL|nr:hypothetical protein DFL_000418 [Arthrobotrys flagrans]
MCHHLERIYTRGHKKRERRVTCTKPKKCQMQGQPWLLQQPINRTCGNKEREIEDDEDDEGEDDDHGNDEEDGGHEGNEDNNKKDDKADKSFKASW